MEPLKPSQCNAVQLDRIWIDHVHHETKAITKWEDNWGSLRKYYSKMANDIGMIQNRERHPISGIRKPLKLPPITNATQKVSSKPFIPVKTSQEVGWRKGYNLERFGRFGRPKGSIIKHFDWPLDALP